MNTLSNFGTDVQEYGYNLVITVRGKHETTFIQVNSYSSTYMEATAYAYNPNNNRNTEHIANS